MAWVGIAISVLVALSLVLIAITPQGSGYPEGVTDFRTAEGIASSVTVGFGGVLDLATGYDLPRVTADPFNFSNTGCTITSRIGPYPQQVLIPAFGGNFMSGTAPAWWFWYIDQATGSVLIVYVIDGTVSLAFTLSGAGCLAVNTSAPGLPNAVMKSPAAMSAAATAGASDFMTAHPTGVSLTMTLENLMTPAGFGPGAASWVVYLTTGSAFFTAPPGSGCSEFDAGVNATNGAVQSSSTYPC